MSYIGNTPVVNTARLVQEVTATQGQTTFYPAGGYTVGQLDVEVNGISLPSGDYTANDGSSVVLSKACGLNDVVRFVAFGTFNVANTYTQAQVDTQIAGVNSTINTLRSSAFRNHIINGSFQVWQRGTSGSGGGYISADRWFSNVYFSTGTISLSRRTDATGQNFTEYARFEQSVAGSVNDRQALYQRIEGTYLVGKTVTVSFMARASKALTGCRTREIFATPQTFALSTSWQRFTFTGVCIEDSGNVRLNIDCGLHNDTWYVDIAEVQVEIGSVATPFERRPYGIELALCQRYYFDFRPMTAAKYATYAATLFTGAAGGGFIVTIPLPNQMRTAPTAIVPGAMLNIMLNWPAAGSSTVTSISGATYSSDQSIVLQGVQTSAFGSAFGSTGFQVYTTAGIFGASAEL